MNAYGGPRPDQVTSLGFVFFFVCVALELRHLSMLGECSATELTPSRSIQPILLYGCVGVLLPATPSLQRGLGRLKDLQRSFRIYLSEPMFLQSSCC